MKLVDINDCPTAFAKPIGYIQEGGKGRKIPIYGTRVVRNGKWVHPLTLCKSDTFERCGLLWFEFTSSDKVVLYD